MAPSIVQMQIESWFSELPLYELIHFPVPPKNPIREVNFTWKMLGLTQRN
jgi:hypothetical protein